MELSEKHRHWVTTKRGRDHMVNHIVEYMVEAYFSIFKERGGEKINVVVSG